MEINDKNLHKKRTVEQFATIITPAFLQMVVRIFKDSGFELTKGSYKKKDKETFVTDGKTVVNWKH